MFSAMNKIRLATKLPVVITGAAFVMAIVIGSISYFTAKQMTYNLIEKNFAAVLEAKTDELKNYLATIEEDLKVEATSKETISALKAFDAAWQTVEGDKTKTLQETYIEKNPHPLGQKEKLISANDGTAYDAIHKFHHGKFRNLLESRGYYDIFLINKKGDLVYSVFKELDYATNLNNGKYKNSDLGNAFRAAMNGNEISFFDFKPYAPSHGAPASFMSIPIIDNGTTIGALVFQMPIDRINKVMAKSTGLGKSGEAVIVGSDFLLRNDSKFSKENDILKTSVDNEAIRKALAGKEGITQSDSYRNTNMEIVAEPFKYRGTSWAVMAVEAVDEVEVPIVAMRNEIILISVILMAIMALVGYFVSKSITTPIAKILKDMESLASGNNDIEISGTNRADEIGDIAKTVLTFKENAIERERLQKDNALKEEKQRSRQGVIEQHIEQFQSEVVQSLITVSQNSEQMQSCANTMRESSNESAEQTRIMGSSTEEALEYVSAASSAGEEMNSAIGEIEHQVVKTKELVNVATDEARQTDEKVSSLTHAAEKIGEIITIIQEIAEQTNLLALNATIEAARAGDAGKGFAVVAAEVKGLATQTAKATEEISTQIANIQTETSGSVAAIKSVANKISEINEFTSAIATAIEEQGAATTEISRNVLSTADKTRDVTENLKVVTESVKNTEESANEVLSSSQSVKSEADSLKGIIDGFLEKVRAA